MPQDENPYRSPLADSAKSVEERLRHDGIRSHLRSKGWLYRQVAIEAPFEGVIEYHGWGWGETVCLDGRPVARKWFNVYLIEFDLLLGGEIVRVAIRHRLTPWFTLAAFRIEIDGVVVYSEGKWRTKR